MGLYALTPGKPEWSTTTPYFKKIKINLENEPAVVLTTSSPAEKLLGIKPALNASAPAKSLITPVPVIEAVGKSFEDSMTITIKPYDVHDDVYYLVMSGKMDLKLPAFEEYTKPFQIDATSSVLTYSVRNGKESARVLGRFVKKPNNYSVALQSKYNPQYHAGGASGLVDGIFGTENWRKGDWQGYQGQDFECIVDLKDIKDVQKVSANFLQDTRSWILMPKKVDFLVSEDGKTFKLLESKQNKLEAQEMAVTILPLEWLGKSKARYIKVIAYNFGKLPEWHAGAGSDAFIFIDEIMIN
jgi:hypothetical protein